MKRWIIFTLTVFTVATLIAAGCSGSGGGKKEDALIDKTESVSPFTHKSFIWSSPKYNPDDAETLYPHQYFSTTLSTGSAETVGGADEAEGVEGKSASSSTTAGTTKAITPNLDGVRVLGTDPSGGVWFMTQYGLFRSNINLEEEKYELLLTEEQLAKDYIDSSTDGIYKIPGGNGPSSLRGTHGLGISFFADPDDPNHYFALLTYFINVDLEKKIKDEVHSKILLYDSNKGFSEFLPNISKQFIKYSNPVNNASAEWAPIRTGYALENYLRKILKSKSVPRGLYYAIPTLDMQTTYHLRYDPVNEKHYLDDTSHVHLSDIYFNYCSSVSNSCLYGDYTNFLNIDPTKCVKKTKDEVNECIIEEMKKNPITIKSAPFAEKDVTAAVTSSNFMEELSKVSLSPTFKNLVSFDLSSIVEEIGDQQISCEGESCSYPSYFHNDKNILNLPFEIIPGENSAVLSAFSSDYSKRLINLVSYSDGSVSSIVGLTEIPYFSFSSSSAETGDLFIYGRIEEKDGVQVSVPYIYSTKAEKAVKLEKNNLNLAPIFYYEIYPPRWIFNREGITLDGKRAFFSAYKSDSTDMQIYYVTLSNILEESDEDLLHPAIDIKIKMDTTTYLVTLSTLG